jgi:NAD(P)H-hydrate epimerase
MVKRVQTYREVHDLRFDTLAIGPGLGLEHASEVLSVIREAAQPMVVDADALNALSRDAHLLKHCAGPRLLTPHPGEMERLYPQRGRTRQQWLGDFLAEYPAALLLKGARTLVGNARGERFINATGNPGMASGGMGDVLTGVCAALAPQLREKDLFQSASLGAWLCGRAAELSVFEPLGSPEFLCASSVVDHLGAAFASLRAREY